jgi:hypothetical protein
MDYPHSWKRYTHLEQQEEKKNNLPFYQILQEVFFLKEIK